MATQTSSAPLSMDKSDSLLSNLQRLFDRLTYPAASIVDVTTRRQSRLLGSLLLFAIFANGMGWLASLSTNRGNTTAFFPMVWAVIIGTEFVSYLLNRSGRYFQAAAASLLLTMLATLGVYIYLLSVRDATSEIINPNLALFSIGLDALVVYASIFFSLRITILTAVTIVVVEVLSLLAFYTNRDILIGLVLWHTLISGFIIFATAFRNVVERGRRHELDLVLQNAVKANADLVQVNAELSRAKALAQESTRLKSEFLNTMSHELRTPLNAINGFTGIMLSGMGGEFDADAQHMLERVDSNGKRLLALINDVLDIAKIEAGRMEITPECVVLRELVTRWSDSISILARNKGLEFTTRVAPELSDTLYIDVERLTKAVTNLLSNAIKFTEKGGVAMMLEAQQEQLRITVRDTGIGIPPHALNYIFEEFRQLDGSSERVYGGSGLGLAIVRNICRMMNGSISVESELGVGSTFTLLLPLLAQPLAIETTAIPVLTGTR